MKPMAAKWMIELHDYFVSHPQIVKNGFRHVGITDFLKQ